MKKALLSIIIFLISQSYLYAFELTKVEINQEFDRTTIWSGVFKDLSGSEWNVSQYYENQQETINTNLYFRHNFDRFTFFTKLHYNNGYESVLQDVDQQFFLSISTHYQIKSNLSVNLLIDPIIQFGGSMYEYSCKDNFSREYHCGTGLPWSDAVTNGYVKTLEHPKSLKLSFKLQF